MTDKLPPNLLALFAPRPPLRWVEPPDHAPQVRRTAPISGVAAFLPELQKYKETDVYNPTESWLQKRDRMKIEKKEKLENGLKEGLQTYKPNEDPNIRGDAFKTLIVARLSYDADERDLEREFGRFGPIERIRIVTDTRAHEKPNKKKKPHRGYAFVVFEREKDMRAALESCDGARIKDRRIKVDVERGRTVKGWKPRRLGGGLGGRGYTKAMLSRPMGPGGFGGGGGFRGGFKGFEGGGRGRGGFRGGFGGRGGGGGFRGGGGGGDFGQRGGDRNGGYGAPSGAPSGPGSDRRNGYGGDRGSSGGYESRGGSRSYDDRHGGGGGGGGSYRDGGRHGDRDGRRTGGNMEPIGSREAGSREAGSREGGRREGGYRERDYDRPPRDEDGGRKRGYDGDGYEDPRKLRRY